MQGTTKDAKMRNDKGAGGHGKEKKGEEVRKGVGLAICIRGTKRREGEKRSKGAFSGLLSLGSVVWA